MSSSSLSSDAVDALARRQWSEARRGAAELLAHLPDVGDHRTQRAVDGLVEQASDALLAVAEVLADLMATGEPAEHVLAARPRALGPHRPSGPPSPDTARRTPGHDLGLLGGVRRGLAGDDDTAGEP